MEISEWRKPSAYLMMSLKKKKKVFINDEKSIDFNFSRECFTGVQHTEKSTEITIILPSAHCCVKPPRLSKITVLLEIYSCPL